MASEEALDLSAKSERYCEPNELVHLHALVVAYAAHGHNLERRRAVDVADAVRSLRHNWIQAREANAQRANEVARYALRNAFDSLLVDDEGGKHCLRVAHAWIDNLRMIATEDLHEQPGKG